MIAVKEAFKTSDKVGTGRISEDALAQLIQKLCGESIPLEVIHALFQSFAGGNAPRGSINYNEFIEWLFESLEASGMGHSGAVTGGLETSQSPKAAKPEKRSCIIKPCHQKSDDNYRLFCSNQHTQEATAKRAEWLLGECDSVKASTPPFNTRLQIPMPDRCEELNIATFGVKLPRVIMKLFENDEMQKLSTDKLIPIPRYALDTFVQKKMSKVLDMCKEARNLPLYSSNVEAVDKLEAFCKDFVTLDTPDGLKITNPDLWEAFVAKHVSWGWQDRLHFDHVLTGNFGFGEDMATALREKTVKIMEKDKEMEVTLEHHALRWLAKAFKGYGPVGCLTDVVNLVYAIFKMEQPSEAREDAAVEAVQKLQEKMDKGDFSELWIPTHLVHDAESDDSLSWLLLEYIHSKMGSQLQVLIQLPQDEKIDPISAYLTSHSSNVQVFRDKDSSNGKAVASTWGKMAPGYVK